MEHLRFNLWQTFFVGKTSEALLFFKDWFNGEDQGFIFQGFSFFFFFLSWLVYKKRLAHGVWPSVRSICTLKRTFITERQSPASSLRVWCRAGWSQGTGACPWVCVCVCVCTGPTWCSIRDTLSLIHSPGWGIELDTYTHTHTHILSSAQHTFQERRVCHHSQPRAAI